MACRGAAAVLATSSAEASKGARDAHQPHISYGRAPAASPQVSELQPHQHASRALAYSLTQQVCLGFQATHCEKTRHRHRHAAEPAARAQCTVAPDMRLAGAGRQRGDCGRHGRHTAHGTQRWLLVIGAVLMSRGRHTVTCGTQASRRGAARGALRRAGRGRAACPRSRPAWRARLAATCAPP